MINIINKNLQLNKPDAVLVDTDNTLYDYNFAHTRAMTLLRRKAFNILGISFKDFDRSFTMARNEIKNKLGETASSHNRLLYIQKQLEILGLGSQILLTIDLEQTYWRGFFDNAHLFTGVTDFLDIFRKMNVPLCVVTDLTSNIQFRKLLHFQLDAYFSYIVTSEESGFDKPNKSSFEIARKKMNLGNNAKIWMIGDSYKNDILGAKRALSAITFHKFHKGVFVPKTNYQADIRFSNFKSLSKYLIKVLPD
jgi:putative hydrolase of the HAD superfamily